MKAMGEKKLEGWWWGGGGGGEQEEITRRRKRRELRPPPPGGEDPAALALRSYKENQLDFCLSVRMAKEKRWRREEAKELGTEEEKEEVITTTTATKETN